MKLSMLGTAMAATMSTMAMTITSSTIVKPALNLPVRLGYSVVWLIRFFIRDSMTLS
jgi:hypothetical protein